MAFVWRAGQEIEYFVNSMYRGFGRDIPTTELEQVHVVKALERFWNEDCKQQQQQQEDPKIQVEEEEETKTQKRCREISPLFSTHQTEQQPE